MNYLIVQQWPNTKGNHAGMSHMCDLLTTAHPREYCKIEMDQTLSIPTRRYRVTRFLFHSFDQWRYKQKYLKEYLKRCNTMLRKLEKNDKIFLLEYHLIHTDQFTLAKYLKKHFPNNLIIALSHLTPTLLHRMGFNKKLIQYWEKPIDKQLTLGSSLSQYFIENGIPSKKIFTGFHYVDNQFYQVTSIKKSNNTCLKAIVIGNLQRDYSLLAEIVKKTTNIEWTICCGHENLTDFFSTTANVKLINYVDENTLKKLMEESSVSVNILEDTIGSNVITTSMAMGLAIIASDVGSIRDYCTTENTLFCKNTIKDFCQSLNELKNNPQKLYNMRVNSIKQSQKFNIKLFHHWLQTI